MAEDQDRAKEQFLYPLSRYRGRFTPQNLTFNANLQEFAQRVGYICALESNGKVTSEAAYHEIKRLWQLLEQSKQELLDQPLPPEPDLPET